jgi:hypothetical protein
VPEAKRESQLQHPDLLRVQKCSLKMRPIPVGSEVVPKARGNGESRSEVPIYVVEEERTVYLACVNLQVRESTELLEVMELARLLANEPRRK